MTSIAKCPYPLSVTLSIRWLMNSPDLGVLSAIDLSRLVCTLHGMYARYTSHLSCLIEVQLNAFLSSFFFIVFGHLIVYFITSIIGDRYFETIIIFLFDL